MFRRPILWFVALLLCVLGAWCLWHRGDRPQARMIVPAAQSPATPATATSAAPTNSPSQPTASVKNTVAGKANRVAQYRLSNTTTPLNDLLRRDSALLLENARIDTANPLDLNIPAHLRAQGDPGAYIIQARGPIDDNFRATLRDAGVTLVSFIPNNAWLVRASQAQATALAAQPGIQAAVPFEPYYKIKSTLLPLAVEQQPLIAGTYLNLVLFADGRTDTLKELARLGVSVLREGPSPFGPVVTVQPRPGSLVPLAQLRGVQIIERSARRVPVNDLARVQVGISANTITTNNYFGLIVIRARQQDKATAVQNALAAQDITASPAGTSNPANLNVNAKGVWLGKNTTGEVDLVAFNNAGATTKVICNWGGPLTPVGIG